MCEQRFSAQWILPFTTTALLSTRTMKSKTAYEMQNRMRPKKKNVEGGGGGREKARVRKKFIDLFIILPYRLELGWHDFGTFIKKDVVLFFAQYPTLFKCRTQEDGDTKQRQLVVGGHPKRTIFHISGSCVVENSNPKRLCSSQLGQEGRPGHNSLTS